MSDAERADRDKAIAEARAAGVAEGKAEAEKGQAEAVAAAVTGERERIKAIVTSDEAKSRMDLATHIAFETDTSAEAAGKLLAAAPEAKTTGQLAAAMAAHGTPGIRTTETDDDAPKAPQLDSVAIFAKLNEPYQKALQGGAR